MVDLFRRLFLLTLNLATVFISTKYKKKVRINILKNILYFVLGKVIKIDSDMITLNTFKYMKKFEHW